MSLWVEGTSERVFKITRPIDSEGIHPH